MPTKKDPIIGVDGQMIEPAEQNATTDAAGNKTKAVSPDAAEDTRTGTNNPAEIVGATEGASMAPVDETTMAAEGVDQAKSEGQQVHDVAPGTSTVTEILDGSPVTHAGDLNLDGDPNVDTAIEHAHQFASMTAAQPPVTAETPAPVNTEGKADDYITGEPQFQLEPSNFQATAGGFQAMISSTIVNAVNSLREENDTPRSSAKIRLNQNRVVGLPFNVIITVEKEK